MQIDDTNLLDLLSLKSKSNAFIQSINFKNEERIENFSD